jgi:uncharacterized membrane protein
MGVENLLHIILLTFFPGLELRASIPYVLLYQLEWFFIPLIIVLNIILGETIFYLLNTILPYILKIKILEKFYNKCVGRIQNKSKNYVDKYGIFGLAIFIGIPLPGSGVYTGALAAFIFGFKRKDFSKANIIGVLIAGTIVTLIVTSGINFFNFLIKL